jgi:tol-pal system protein YbgF
MNPPGRRTAVPTSATWVSDRGRARLQRALFCAVLAAGAVARPAHAGLFDDAEARRRIDALREELSQQGKDNEARIAKLEEEIRNIGVVELLRQIDSLNAQIAALRGQVEVLGNDNQQLQKRQRDFYLDLDSRLKHLEGTPGGAPTPGAPGTAPPAGASPETTGQPGSAPEAGPLPPTGTPPKVSSREEQAREMKAYDAASGLFRRNDFPSAIDAFRAFLKDHPESALAANASYWIGISYANMKDYRSALAAQQELLAKYPQSPKAPDALLAVAAIEAERGNSAAARNTLEDIIARFPTSEAAGKARTRLAALQR